MNASLESLPERVRALVGQGVDAIDTPALVVDLDAANRNLQRMAEFAERHNVRLRPHAKMHKSAAFAHMQLQAGAVGLCTQTVAEAEALAAGGANDLFISNQVVAPAKLHRVAALAHLLKGRGGRLAIAVDSEGGIERLAQAMRLTNAAIDVFVEVDIGQGRCGVAPGAAVVDLVRTLAARAPSLRYAGLHAYQGGAQHLRSVAERRAAIDRGAEQLRATRALLAAADLAPPLITGAGTGTFAHEAASGLWGEIQPGSFLFMDADYARNERDPAQPRSSTRCSSSRRSSASPLITPCATPATRATPSTAVAPPSTRCPANRRWPPETAATKPPSSPRSNPAANCPPCRPWATPCG